MTTLIAYYNSNGCIGRCDAKCYNAEQGSECTCICGGINHAQGEKTAIGNTAMLARQLADDASRNKEVKQVQLLSWRGVADQPYQLPLL